MLFGKRMKEVLQKLELTQVGLAEKIGISNVVINRYIKGKTSPNYDFLNKLATTFNINITWLITGEGPMFPTRNIKTIGSREYFNLPILDGVSCGSPQEIDSAEPIDHIMMDTTSLSGDFNTYFAFYASGDSMEPYISNGDVVIVKQCDNWIVADERICVIRVEGEVTLKKVKSFAEGREILLQPFNKDYAPILLDRYTLKDSLLIGIAVMSIRNL